MSDCEYFDSEIINQNDNLLYGAKKVQWAEPLFTKKLYKYNSILNKKCNSKLPPSKSRKVGPKKLGLINKMKNPIGDCVRVKKVEIPNTQGRQNVVLNIGYLNADNWVNKIEQIIEYVVKDNIDAMAVVETHHYTHMGDDWKQLWDNIGFRCEMVCRDVLNGDKKGGGIMWAWRSSLNARIWNNSDVPEGREWTKKEKFWLTIEWPKYKLALGAIYMACDSPRNTEWNDNMYECLTDELIRIRMTYNVVLVGDFNGRIGNSSEGVVNGDPVQNANGVRLLNFTRRNNLVILNRENLCTGIWTRMFDKQRSTIDYFLIESANVRSAVNMTIHDEGTNETDSDHNWMDMKLELKETAKIDRSPKAQKKFKPRWRINEKTDWEKFELEMDKVFSKEFKGKLVVPGRDVDQMGAMITEAMCKVANAVIGTKRKARKRKKLPREVVDAIKKRKEARKAYAQVAKFQPGEPIVQEAWDNYLGCKRVAGMRKAIYRKGINKKTCEKITNAGRNSSTMFWKEVSKGAYKPGIGELLVENVFITEKETIKAEVEKYFCNQAKKPNFTEEDWIEFKEESDYNLNDHNYSQSEDLDVDSIIAEHNYSKRLPSIPKEQWDRETGRKFTKAELMRIIKKLKLGKAYGDDKIPNEFLKFGGHGLWACLVTLLNEIRDKEKVPELWNKGNISLIHKGGVHYLLDNYRGITIMSNLGKLLSSILRERLDIVVERENILGEIQNGFRSGRGGDDNLLILRHVIEKSRAKGDKCFLSFIDLRKAYDRVWREGLWESLIKLGFSGKLLALIKALYVNTQQRVNLDWGNTKWFSSEIGLKQGCVLSPILFALFLKCAGDKLLKTGVGIQFENHKFPALFFADDMILMSNKAEDMNKLLRVLGGILARIKMEVNCSKSQMLVIKGQRGEIYNWNILNYRQEVVGKLDEVRFYKYLGVLFCNEGRNPFNKQLRKIVSKAKQLGGAIRAKSFSSWDKVGVANALWNAMACPAILYGCEVIQFNAETYKKLEVAQNTIGRWILGARKFCSIIALRNELCWKSMKHRIYEAKLKFWGKICFQDTFRWAKATIVSSVREGWKSKWADEIMSIRREVGMGSMCNIKTYKEWCNRVSTTLKEWDKNIFQQAKTNMSSLMWYSSPYNAEGKIYPYVNGSKAAGMLFNIKAGSWVLKKDNNLPVKCKLCNDYDSEIHRIFRCNALNAIRDEVGISALVYDLWVKKDSEVEILSSITTGSKLKCLSTGSKFLGLDQFIMNY